MNFKRRYVAFGGVILVVFSILIITLANLTIVKGDQYSDISEDKKRRTITLKGQRGEIFDVNGVPLAYDQESYDVVFSRDQSKTASSDNAYYTQILIETIDIIEKNGGKTIDSFAIKRNEAGEYYFDFGDISEEAAAAREKSWRENMYVNDKLTPLEVYNRLRTRYRIPEDMPYEEAFKVLSIWQETQLSSYMAYNPIKIATNVNTQTVAEIEANGDKLDGVSISEGTVRIYPKNDTAAHIIGYLGEISTEEQLQEYEEKGYTSGDLIGLIGVESSMEEYLTGNSTEKQGQRVVDVNSKSEVIKEISYTPPKEGDDVVLTIDIELQAALEAALGNNIETIQQLQLEDYRADKADYDEELNGRELNLAKSGAAVVMDVKTGNVLAMASYPSFDLNLFTNGISEEDYAALRDDPATPLFNKAISSKSMPGSTFKMVTAIAGLMEGEVGLNETISDEGEYDKHVVSGRAPSCWVRPYFSRHSDQDVIQAIKNSCNYYFFEVSDRLGIDKLNEWANRFGLASSTGIQLPNETIGQIGNQQTLYDSANGVNDQKTSLPYLVKNLLIETLKGYGQERGINYSEEQLESVAEQLIALCDKGETQVGPQIREILSQELDIPERISRNQAWDNQINTILLELMWNPTMTVLTGIGEGTTAVTPIAMARYFSSLVNGGTVYNANIIDKVVDNEGNVIMEQEPEIFEELNIPDEYMEAIKEGMRGVVSAEEGGTAGRIFQNFKYKDQIGGKTGTSQNSQIDLENNSWMTVFAPYDDPEIAVVVFIPNGYSGSYSGYTVMDIVEFYMDRKNKTAANDIPTQNDVMNEDEEQQTQKPQETTDPQETDPQEADPQEPADE